MFVLVEINLNPFSCPGSQTTHAILDFAEIRWELFDPGGSCCLQGAEPKTRGRLTMEFMNRERNLSPPRAHVGNARRMLTLWVYFGNSVLLDELTEGPSFFSGTARGLADITAGIGKQLAQERTLELRDELRFCATQRIR